MSPSSNGAAAAACRKLPDQPAPFEASMRRSASPRIARPARDDRRRSGERSAFRRLKEVQEVIRFVPPPPAPMCNSSSVRRNRRLHRPARYDSCAKRAVDSWSRLPASTGDAVATRRRVPAEAAAADFADSPAAISGRGERQYRLLQQLSGEQLESRPRRQQGGPREWA